MEKDDVCVFCSWVFWGTKDQVSLSKVDLEQKPPNDFRPHFPAGYKIVIKHDKYKSITLF